MNGLNTNFDPRVKQITKFHILLLKIMHEMKTGTRCILEEI